MYDSPTASCYYDSSFHCGVGVGMVRVIYGEKNGLERGWGILQKFRQNCL